MAGADVDRLVETGLVVEGRGDEINWIGMHPRLANVFMTLLANGLISHEPHRVPLADFASNAVDAQIDSFEGLRNALLGGAAPGNGESLHTDTNQIRDLFASFTFEQVVPADLDDVDIDRILQLRQRYPGELLRYQDAVADFAKRYKYLTKIRSLDILKQDLEGKYDALVKPALADLEAALKGVGIGTTIGCLSISFAAPGLLEQVGVAFDPVVAAASGGALVVAGILHGRRTKKAEALQRCDYSWLYRVEKGLAPASVAERIKSRLSSILG